LSGAALNVRINAAALKNRSVAGGLIERIEAIEGETGSLQEEIRNRILGRGGQSPR
jgi:hypothetical protein